MIPQLAKFQEGWNHQPVMELGDSLDVFLIRKGSNPIAEYDC